VSAFVFLGPSLPLDAARELLEAQYLPPVRQGDVLRLLDRRAKLIVIIDGAFEDTPAVWHNEILLAIERGIVVIGAASLGALRAAELWPYGMLGVGLIYRFYRRGLIEDDDEVAVIHAPWEVGGWPLSEALVNIRMTCRYAARRAVISRTEAEWLVRHAKEVFYKERSWDTLLGQHPIQHLLGRKLGPFSDWVKSNAVDQKAADARLALMRATHILNGARAPSAFETLHVEPTSIWLKAIELSGLSKPTLGYPDRSFTPEQPQ
jgi:hypothetical protein